MKKILKFKENSQFSIFNSQFFSGGFTLIELLVVILVIFSVGVLISSVLFSALRGANKTNTIDLVRRNGNSAITQMSRMIRYSQSFNGVSTDGVSYTTCDGRPIVSVPLAISSPPPRLGLFSNIANLIQRFGNLGKKEVSGLFSKLASLIPNPVYLSKLPKDPKQSGLPVFLAVRNFFQNVFNNLTKPSEVFAATGGTITTSGGYTIHTFTSNGTFASDFAGNVEYLVVAGGGGGGSGGGGGGAGGMRTGTGVAVAAAQAYSITVGAGGAGGTSNASGSTGSNSVFSTITSTGGGGGGGRETNGVAGGSGGGGGISGFNRTGGAGTSGQGNNGGDNYFPTANFGAGGGGGASAVGANGTSGGGGNGGAGTSSSFSGSAVTYAGGGGGGTHLGVGTIGSGGSGGGGAGGNPSVAGTANTGGGGGGGNSENVAGGAGGSGIVIIRYLSTPTPPSSCPSTGLIGYWKMDETSWNGAPGEVADSSGNGKSGTALSAATTVTGKFGRAGSFNTQDTKVQLSSAISLNLIPYSISVWSLFPLPTTVGGWRTLTRGTNDHQIIVDSSGLIGVFDNASATGFRSSAYNIVNDTSLLAGWHNIIAAVTGTSTNFYVDGIFKGAAPFKSNADIAYFGNYQGGTQNFGTIDDLRIYNYSLSSADISALQTCTPSTPPTPTPPPPTSTPTPTPPPPTPTPTQYHYLKITGFDGGITTFICNGSTIASASATTSVSLIDTSSVDASICYFTCSQNNIFSPPNIGINFSLTQKGNPQFFENKAKADFQTSVSVRNY